MTVRGGAGGTSLTGTLSAGSNQNWASTSVLAGAGSLSLNMAQRWATNTAILAGAGSLALNATRRINITAELFAGTGSLIANATLVSTPTSTGAAALLIGP